MTERLPGRLSRAALLSLGLCAAATAHPPLQDSTPPAPGATSALVSTRVIGMSLGGRPMRAVVVMAGEAPLEQRQGVLVVATLDGLAIADHRLVAATLDHLRELPDLAQRLGRRALVLVPVANPDGLMLENLGSSSGPRPVAGNRRPDDADRDGRVDEDGPSDLDGDGEIAWMRVPDGQGEWVVDEHDPRAMRKARTTRGERGTHRLLREGLDNDGDGAWQEDDTSGVLLDENFPHGWMPHRATAGAYPLSEPESRALADFVHGHPGFGAVLVIGDEDTLASLPGVAKSVERGGFGGGFRKALDGVLEEDGKVFEEWKRRFQALPGGKHEVKGESLQPGGLLAWVYHQAGRWPIGLRPWAIPEELPKPDASKPEKPEPEPEPEPGGGDAGRTGEAGSEGAGAAAAGGGNEQVAAAAGEATGGESAASAASGAEDARGSDEPVAADAAGAVPGPAGEAATAAGEKPEAGAAGPGDKAGAEPDGPTSDKDSPVSAAVLAWLDSQRAGAGFLPWTAFEHPEFGEVEIGGLSAATRLSAGRLDSEQEALAARLGDFLLEALAMLPVLAFEDLEITQHGEGLYTVEVALVNTGVLPTSSRFAADARLARPVRVRAQLPPGVERLHGPPQELVRHLAGGGGRAELRWVLAGASTGTRLLITADADTVDDITLEVTLP